MNQKKVIIGTRGSALARWQAEHIAARLREAHAGLDVELAIVVTEGDRFQAGPLIERGGKGVWVKEIEEGLLAGTFDLAVHSLKDVPAALAPGLALVAIPPRADARDAFVSREGQTWQTLPQGARIGTSSLRRVAQLKLLRPDFAVEVLRGNVDTRLRKVKDGVVDAAVLASAGLDRLGFAERITARFSLDEMLPAIGQGALALEAREGDARVAALVGPLADANTTAAVRAERALLASLGAGCQTPLGGHAVVSGVSGAGRNDRLLLRGLVAKPDASVVLRDQIDGLATDAEALGNALAMRLLAAGAREILDAV